MVELEVCKTGKSYVGEISSLSSSGVSVRIPIAEKLIELRQHGVLRFILPIGDVPFALRAELKRAVSEDKSWEYAFQFVNSDDPMQDTQRDKLVWRYLMDLQRQSQG